MSVRKHRKIGGRYHWSNCLLFDYEFLLRWMTAGYSSLTFDRQDYLGNVRSIYAAYPTKKLLGMALCSYRVR